MRACILLTILLLAAGARAAAAQGVVHGRVTDAATGRALGPALVTLLELSGGPMRQGVTSDSGLYRFRNVSPGQYRVQVELLGYTPSMSAVQGVAGSDTLLLSVSLTPTAIPLDSLTAQVGASPTVHPTLEGFYLRRERGVAGVFITREQIEQRGPSQLWDMVRSQARTDRSLRNLMARRDPCQMELFVDGWSPRQAASEPLEDLINRFSPHDIEGIEIYRNMSGLPAELATPRAQECGVIALWTRRGR